MSGTSPATGVGGLAVLAEITARIELMRSAARARGTVLLPPLLMLGTSERVGSNWLSDTLRPVMDQHNEPFRQQVGACHPLSALNPRAVPVLQVTGTAGAAVAPRFPTLFDPDDDLGTVLSAIVPSLLGVSTRALAERPAIAARGRGEAR